MSGARTAGGLICSHGSDLDTRIPRAKVPKSALPQSLRVKLGFDKKRPLAKQSRSRYSEDTNPYAPGANVLQPRSSADGKYKAGCQKNFLRRGSGSSFSSLAARKRKNKQTRGPQRRSHENKTTRTTGQPPNHKRISKRRVQHHRHVSEQCKMSLNQIEDALHNDYQLPTDDGHFQ